MYIFNMPEPTKLIDELITLIKKSDLNIQIEQKDRIGIGSGPDYKIFLDKQFYIEAYLNTRCDIVFNENLFDGHFIPRLSMRQLSNETKEHCNYMTPDDFFASVNRIMKPANK